ncbi:MAG TPA: hypothetical protein VF989_05975 [Polyangiaceae bacterium]
MNTTPINGTELAMELYRAVRQSSKDIEQANREAAHEAAEEELEQGLARAEELHQQADRMRTGAIISGAMTAAAGGVQAAAAFDALDQKWGKAAGGVPNLANAVDGFFDAAAKHHEADAEGHSARARAAGHRVDEHTSAAAAARDLARSAQGLARSIADAEHESMRAVLSQRA